MSNKKLSLRIGEFSFLLKLEWELAPDTCKKITELLPFESKLIQARWSGDAGWVPMGKQNLNLPPENLKNAPEPGALLLYSGPLSETEIYIPYGFNRFACKEGQLEGNHFASILEGKENLKEVGRKLLWEGALKLRLFSLV